MNGMLIPRRKAATGIRQPLEPGSESACCGIRSEVVQEGVLSIKISGKRCEEGLSVVWTIQSPSRKCKEIFDLVLLNIR